MTAALMFDQAVLAGQFMSGVYPGLALHKTMSNYTVASVALTIAAAIVLRVAGRGPRWLIPTTVALFFATALQTYAGYNQLLGLHVPLGVAIIALTLALTIWIWRTR